MSFVERLNSLELEQAAMEALIEVMARKVAEARGTEIGRSNAPGASYTYNYPYNFKEYERSTFDDSFYPKLSSDDPRLAFYESGTPMIVAYFGAWVGDSYESLMIMFPESYFDDANWLEAEQDNINKVAEKKAARQAEDQARWDERDRKEFERLKAKLGED